MLLDTWGASFLGNLLAGKEVKRSKIPGQWVITAGERRIRKREGGIRAGLHFMVFIQEIIYLK